MKSIISKICRSSKPIDRTNLKKILFVKLFAIGDCLNSTPALRALRKGLPEAQIDVMVGSWSSSVFRNNPHLDKLIVVEDSWFRQSNTQPLIKLLSKLRREKYDAILLLHRAPKLGFFFRLCKAQALVGLDLEKDGYCLTHPVLEKGVTHEIEIYNSLIDSLKIPLDGTRMEIFPTKDEEDRAKELWEGAGFDKSDTVIGVVPGGAVNPGEVMPKRVWPYYGMLSVMLLKVGYKVVYFGGSGDVDALDDLPSGDDTYSFIGKCSLAVSADLMKRCRIVVAHDSGPMHLAAASGTCVLSLFAPTDPRRKAPLGKGNRFLAAKIECAPCYHRGHWLMDCRRECLEIITPDQVMKLIHKMMEI